MKKLLITLFITMLALGGCNTKSDETTKKNKPLEEVKVEIKTNPETLKSNEKVEVQAIVTQGKEKVTDADDVKFEIWKDGEEKKEMLDAKNKGNGVYAIDKTFPSDGVYHIIAHTNARDMHVMPEVKVAVGNAKVEDTKKETDGHHDDHAHGDTMIHLMADGVKANTESTLKAHVKQKEEALTGAEVQLEIWKDGAEKHEFIPAKEGSKGEYTSTYTFKEAGTYKVKVHVRKGDLHEHKEETVEVK